MATTGTTTGERRLPSSAPGSNGARLRLLKAALWLGSGLTSVVPAQAAFAQDATWKNAPANARWNDGGNWTPAAVPTGTASLGPSNTTDLTVDASTAVGTVHILAGAPQYMFHVQGSDTHFTINGAGIVNDSANRPLFVIQTGSPNAALNAAFVDFTGASSAGNASWQVGSLSTTSKGEGSLDFHDTSTAAASLIHITSAGQTLFLDSSTAAGATIVNEAHLTFAGQSQGGQASITNYDATFIGGTASLAQAVVENSNGFLEFSQQATAGNATITSDPGASRVGTLITVAPTPFVGIVGNLYNIGQVYFFNTATAGHANLINNAGNGTFVPADPAVVGCTGCASVINNGSMAIFAGNATAGSSQITNNGGTSGSFFNVTYFNYVDPVDPAFNDPHQLVMTANNMALTLFGETSSAGNATIVNTNGAWTAFFGSSNAASSTISANSGATIWLREQSNGGSANLIANNGGTIALFDTATAGNAIVTGNAGAGIFFNDQSSGGTARFIDNAGARIDISGLTAPGTQIGSVEGGGNLFLGSRALTVGGNNLSTTIGGVIADGGVAGGTGGSLVKTGTGTLTLTGASTYTGATALSQGSLIVSGSLASASVQVGAGTTLGGGGTISGAVQVADGGHVAPGNSPGTLTVGSLLLSAGSVLDYQLGPPGIIGGGVNDLINVTGNLTLDGTLNVTDVGGFGNGVYRLINYGGALTDNGLAIGTVPTASGLLIQAGGGQVNLVVGAGGATQFWDGADTAGNGVVDGGSGTWTLARTNWTNASGSLNQAWNGKFAVFSAAAGTVTVVGPIDFTGMQFLTNGYHLVAGANAALNLVGAEAVVRADPGVTAEIAVPIAGAGKLTKDDPGTLILSASNLYAGGTRIAAGTLQIGAGGASGSIVGNIDDAAALVFARSDTYDFSGTISGAGTVTQAGSGTLRFGGTQTYSGATNVTAGTLQVDGSLASSPLNVAAAGTLTGTGTVGATSMAGTISPGGASAGTLTVAGNYAQLASSTYAFTLPTSGAADLVRITGAAALSGGTVRIANSGSALYHLGARTTILTASGGRTGTFAGTSLATPLAQPFLTFGLGYNATDAFLQIQRNTILFASAGTTANQTAVAGGVEALAQASPLYVALAEVPDLATARNGFDSLSGEIHASARGIILDEDRYLRDAAFGRLGDSGSASGAAIWGHALGAWGSADGGGGAARLTRSAEAVFAGIDGGFGAWRAGLVGGYTHSHIRIDPRASAATIHSWQLGAYGGGRWGGTSAKLGAAYGWYRLKTRRSVAFTGFADSDRGDYGAHALQLFGEVGQQVSLGAARIEPFAGLAYVSLHTDRFAETGGGAALSGAAADSHSTFGSLGLRASAGIGGGASLRASAAWRRAFGRTVPYAMLALGGGTPFTITGAPIARDAVALDAGLSFRLGAGSIGLDYTGQLASRTRDNGAQLRLAIPF